MSNEPIPEDVTAMRREMLEKLQSIMAKREPRMATPYLLITELQETLWEAWRRLSAAQSMIDQLTHRKLDSLDPFERGSIIQNDVTMNEIVILKARKLLDAMNGHPTVARAHGLDYPHTTGEKQ